MAERIAIIGWMRRCALALALLLATPAALAAPWAEPGDAQLRRDIELLAAYDIVPGPITTWPISWAQISGGIADMEQKLYPAHVEAALSRVEAKMPKVSDYRGIGIEASAAATNDAVLVRGFDAVAREDGETALSVDKHFSSTYIKASIGWRDGQVGNDIHFDNSYIAQAWSNWVFYAGTLPQWWGGGWDGGLLISTNARPIPRVGVQRLDPHAFETRWLSWLGNWNVFISAARLEKKREDFERPLVIETRVSLTPVRGLDISLSRTLQICGSGRPCDFSTFRKALVGFGNADNTGIRATDPSNQIAGVDIRFARRIGDVNFATFIEMIGEDASNTNPTKTSADLGFTLGGHWAAQDLGWGLRFEASDTEADNLFGLEVNQFQDRGSVPNVTFNSFIFTDGFTFRDRTIGHPLDTDSRLFTGELSLLDAAGRSWWLRYRRALINVSDTPQSSQGNRLSNNREEIDLVEFGGRASLPYGDVRLELRFMGDQPDTPGVNDFKAQVEASWSVRF